jgi:hypothetical protein
MPSYTWQARPNGGASLTNIQSVNIGFGRNYQQDPFRASNVTVTGRGYTSPPSIAVGDYFQIVALNGATEVWSYSFYVTDFVFNYGISSKADTWTLTLQDSLGNAGKANVTGSWINNTQSGFALSNTATLANINIDVYIGGGNGTAYLSAQSFTNQNLLSVLNQIIATEQGMLFGGNYDFLNGVINWTSRGIYQTSTPQAEFTDTTPQVAAIGNTYNEFEVAGLTGNYATKVNVNPVGLATQSAGSGYKFWDIDTYDVSTTQAGETATYALSTLSTATSRPISIRVQTKGQTNDAAIKSAFPGNAVNINFRGTKYTCLVEGGSINGTPTETTIVYNLTPLSEVKFNFTLNSTYYGVLDQDKLG